MDGCATCCGVFHLLRHLILLVILQLDMHSFSWCIKRASILHIWSMHSQCGQRAWTANESVFRQLGPLRIWVGDKFYFTRTLVHPEMHKMDLNLLNVTHSSPVGSANNYDKVWREVGKGK